VTGHVSFHAWRGRELAGGLHLGTGVDEDGLRPVTPVGTRRYVDPHTSTGPRDQVWAAWVSPAVSPGHPFTSLVPSWNAETPGDSWLEVEARVSGDGVRWTRWFTLGRWATSADGVAPTSVPGQACAEGVVDTDELQARDGVTWSTYQLRLVLHRGPASDAVPAVTLVGVVVAHPGEHLTSRARASASSTSHGGPVELAVPAYSQHLHRGDHPGPGAGAKSWCSPTSTAMVLASWGRGPSEADLAGIAAEVPDRAVVHAARSVFDHGFDGAGNWSFNTAYAAGYGVEAFVTRLRSLDEAELFVRAGIPLVASVSFRSEELDGAGYDTRGHLLTLVGFDAAGDVVCNDPASHGLPSNDEVRVVYDRKQLETAWLDGSGGLVYVIRPVDVPLPAHPRPAEPNW
jgi:hypothetical protein